MDINMQTVLEWNTFCLPTKKTKHKQLVNNKNKSLPNFFYYTNICLHHDKDKDLMELFCQIDYLENKWSSSKLLNFQGILFAGFLVMLRHPYWLENLKSIDCSKKSC
jgi:hypothetical protein